MIDIHCHILPGVDIDGPSCPMESFEMARLAVEDGIRTIVATPHLREQDQSVPQIHEKVAVLNHSLKSAGIPLDILPGAEANANLDMDFLSGCTLNDKGYVLLEFSRLMPIEEMSDIVYDCCRVGLKPIIAHAERLPVIQRGPNQAADLNQSGAFLQITAESLTGYFGVEARFCARYLLRRRYVHLIATDAHSNNRRRPALSEGVRVAASIIGDNAARQLVQQNPAAVIRGSAMNA
jgi:protein-tyrosine phosphatase